MIDVYRCRKGAREDDIEERNRVRGDRLRGGEQIKAKGASKGGWKAMERDGKPGSVSWTGVACQPLLPGETPMRAPGAGEEVLRGCGDGRCRGVVTLAKSTVSLRTTLSHARRMPQRGQSFHNTGARGSGAGALVHVGEQSEGEESGHNTALTRRGLLLELLS